MKNKIIPSIWFQENSKEAFEEYVAIFPKSQITNSNQTVTEANLMGVAFLGINGGPMFTPNPTISFMPAFESKEVLTTVWNKLLDGGKILMPLAAYPFSEYYGWIEDKNKVSWQLYYGKLDDVNQQQITPTIMFSDQQQGKCQEAIDFYARVFPDFHSQGVLTYPEGDTKGQVMHTQFQIKGYTLAAMDSGVPMPYNFTEGVSLIITCQNQDEIDYYWNQFTRTGTESQCGWCKDPFQVNWQIIPENLDKIMERNPNAWEALMKMKKIIIADLENA